jgi:hypothetical protein
MVRVKEFRVDVFNAAVMVFIGNPQDMISYLRDKKKNQQLADSVSKGNFASADGMEWGCQGGNQIIWLEKLSVGSLTKLACHIATTAHEAFHATADLMNAKGVEYGPEVEDSNEAFAYTIGWIMQNIIEPKGYIIYKQSKKKKNVKNSNS